MTPEEFALFRAEELLVDSTLSLALDPSLRLEIGDSLYAVTEVGTFIANRKKEKDLNIIIHEVRNYARTSKTINPIVPISSSKWDKDYKDMEQTHFSNAGEVLEEHLKKPLNDFVNLKDIEKLAPNEELNLHDGIRFINTYGSQKNNKGIHMENIELDKDNPSPKPSKPQKPSTNQEIINVTLPTPGDVGALPRFHNGYNTTEFLYAETNGFNRFLANFFGHNIGRENYFDDRHRAQLYVYELNFKFFTVTGIKARLQYRRWLIPFILPIWVSTVSERMAFGINHLQAEITEDIVDKRAIPQNAVAIGTINNLSAQINGVLGEFVTQAYRNADFLEDWTDEISMMVPKVAVWGNTLLNPGDFQKQLYAAPRDAIISMLHTTANKWVRNPLTNVASREQYTAPRAAMFPDPSGKRQIYGMGVKEYDNIGTKTIRLNLSGGFSLGKSGDGKLRIGPYIPREVNYKSFDIFVSIRHKGLWRGVRIVKP